MDMARPQGVVFDESLGLSLLPKAIQKQFDTDEVYIRGVAEDRAVAVYLTNDVRLPSERKKPFGSQLFQEETIEETLSHVRQSAAYVHRLRYTPVDPSRILVAIAYPAMQGGRRSPSKWKTQRRYPHFKFEDEDGDPRIVVNYQKFAASVKGSCRATWPIRVRITYPAATSDLQPVSLG